MKCGPVTLTPDDEVGGRLVDAPGVARHAGVRPGVRDVRGGDEQAARLEQGEPGQLHRAAGQHALTLKRENREKQMRKRLKMWKEWKISRGMREIWYWDPNMESNRAFIP